MRGRALDGAWRFWWEDSTAGPSLVREVAWYRAWDRSMVLAGKQAVQTSPLLDSFDLAGAQYGWNSVRRRGEAGYFEGQQLTMRQATPIRTFRGSAPPASVVVLKLDGARVATQQVGYSGEYEFVDVQLPSRGLIVVEIEIYQRQNLTVPIEVRRQLSTASALLLADGATTVATGGGLAGRFTSGFVGSTTGEPSHPGGYFFVRHGLSDWATAEASVETIDSHIEGSAGIVAQLSRPFLLQATLVGGGSEVGWDAGLSGSFERGILSVRSQSQPAGLTFYGVSADRWDHIAEGFYRLSSGLDLGLIVRRINDGVEEADFVKPTVRWRPFSGLYLSAYPDSYGDYQANLFAQPGHNVWLAVNYATTTNAELTVGVAPTLQVGLTAEAGGGLDERYTAYLGGTWARFPGMTFKAGAITSGGRSGGLLSVNAPIGWGLLGALDYQAVPSRVSGPTSSQPRLSLSVIADLAVAGRGLVPASASGMVRGTGAVAGRLRLAAGLSLPGVSLADVNVLVDGRSRGVTGAQGTYFIGFLPEGVHTVEIDVGNLPIALVPVKSLRVARVVAGGVTRVDFELRVEFGLAGRVRDAIGTPLPGIRVELATASGEIVARGRTDGFGLYRIDEVLPGHYVVRLAKDGVPAGVVAPSREVVIVDDFLFDQDLKVPVVVAPPAEQEKPEPASVVPPAS
ncbi:MAG TPA: carboxypeptidase-like regulatory domain-containing protein [Solirubrobacterales bacterium]|nr:carboxypeptidase-like regulatory domain-containing protein [Solirubrobacterales bacterium]